MPVSGVRLSRSRGAAGERVVRLGVPLLDEYLEFLAGRCRPNTVLAVAYDLKVFFTVVGKPPRRVRPVDVLAFMTAQRAGGQGRLQIAGAGDGGVSARTLRRRLSSVSGRAARRGPLASMKGLRSRTRSTRAVPSGAVTVPRQVARPGTSANRSTGRNRRENSPGGTRPWTSPVASSTRTQVPARAVPLGNRYPLAVRAPSL
jgi:hypothetical protein